MNRSYRPPLMPGLSAQEQWKAGHMDLLSTTFETFERNIRDQLGRILSPGGFDPARDIEAITVNRWPHGYAYGQDPETGEIAHALDEVPPERAPWVVGRRRFGRIAIANSDSAANAMTEAAIGQAHRAVMDLVGDGAETSGCPDYVHAHAPESSAEQERDQPQRITVVDRGPR